MDQAPEGTDGPDRAVDTVAGTPHRSTPSARVASERVAAHADLVREQHDRQDDGWRAGSTRRTFLAGFGMAGVAALGSQLVTTRVAYAAAPERTNTLVVITLRGGLDGLRMLVPASAALGLDDLRTQRPDLVPGESERMALPGARGWAAHESLRPLLRYWGSGELAFVPAVLSPGATRSHFQSTRILQTGSVSPVTTGWLDRLLAGLGPGTTFRAMGMGEATSPLSYLGQEPSLVLNSLDAFTVPAERADEHRTLSALEGLYRGFPTDLSADVRDIIGALVKTAALRAGPGTRPGVKYPTGAFGLALAEVATILRGEVGMQVCTLDVGGWDTHSGEAHSLDPNLAHLAAGLDAFMRDLGRSRRSRVTVLVQTELGRRVAQNGDLGTDHGLGSVIMLLGGGLRRADVYGKWPGMKPEVLDQGDVPGANHPFDVMAELAHRRLGLNAPGTLFPGHAYRPLGLAHH